MSDDQNHECEAPADGGWKEAIWPKRYRLIAWLSFVADVWFGGISTHMFYCLFLAQMTGSYLSADEGAKASRAPELQRIRTGNQTNFHPLKTTESLLVDGGLFDAKLLPAASVCWSEDGWSLPASTFRPTSHTFTPERCPVKPQAAERLTWTHWKNVLVQEFSVQKFELNSLFSGISLVDGPLTTHRLLHVDVSLSGRLCQVIVWAGKNNRPAVNGRKRRRARPSQQTASHQRKPY